MFVIICSNFLSFAVLKHFSATQVTKCIRKSVYHHNNPQLLCLLLIKIHIYLMPRHFLYWNYGYLSLLLAWELIVRWKPIVVVVGVSGALRGTAGLPLLSTATRKFKTSHIVLYCIYFCPYIIHMTSDLSIPESYRRITPFFKTPNLYNIQ
jgi:hypothetical protein